MSAARSNTGVRFPSDLYAELAKAAADRGLSVNFLIVAAVRDFLPRLIPADEFSLVRASWNPEARS